MLLRPFTDLHCEFWPCREIRRVLTSVVPALPADKKTVALISGDLGMAHRKSTWLTPLSVFAKQFMAVVWVAGNHFFYHNDFFGRTEELKDMVSLPHNVHFLENESVEIEGTIFIGATMWTDFEGSDPLKMQNAQQEMNDFLIVKKATGGVLLPKDTVDAFYNAKTYIFDSIRQAGANKTVVVTHHGISPLSISDRYRGHSLNSAFITDLSEDIYNCGPNLWVHGHVHDSFDYKLGKTRVIVNPFGYVDDLNKYYRKDLVLKL
jgi:Icc-related predicted phosphoesterase